MKYRGLINILFDLSKTDEGITLIDGKKDWFIPYSQLWQRSVAVSDQLKQQGAEKGSEVIIKCKKLENYIYALWGCIIGKYIAVPVDVASNEYKDSVNNKVYSILENSYLIYDEDIKAKLELDSYKERSLNIQTVKNHIEVENVNELLEEDKEDIVYVQFSSGSTGEPRGVMLRKKNVISNAEDMIDFYKMDKTDLILSWQPLTHCYGLIAFHVLPIVLGKSQCLIVTDAFMQNPLLWLDKVNEYRATRLGTIPFALAHFNAVYKKSNRKFDWDLSCIKSMIIGGEQVKGELCEQFEELVRKYNYKPHRIAPVYGLAEATSLVCSCPMDTSVCIHRIERGELEIGNQITCLENEDASNEVGATFLEMGYALKRSEMQIRDDSGNVMPEKTIGHIWVRGASVTNGYYKNPDITKELIDENNWLNTGDVGFILNQKLTIVGREKELVVVNGKKYSCIDIEDIIKRKVEYSDFGIAVVCNGINKEKNSEEAVVFVETTLDFDSMISLHEYKKYRHSVIGAIFETVGIMVEHVIPIKEIPRTFSGKLKRKALTNQYNEGEFEEIQNKLEQDMKRKKGNKNTMNKHFTFVKIRETVTECIESLFNITVSDYELPFQDYGIVSVNVPHFIDKINEVFEIEVSVAAFFNCPNINQFSHYLETVMNEESNQDGEIKVNNISQTEEKIAVVGMSCRFPGGANSLKEYWDFLISGKDGITDIPEGRWELEKYYDEDENAPGKMYCKKGGFLDQNVDKFDARFFNISPKEAAALDPQQRLLLELTWEAFENGDLDITKYNGSDTGVYLGLASNEYTMAHLYSGDLSNIDAYSLTGTCMSTACGRVSYTFGFEGPCLSVDTACSSVLTALHLACTGIKNRETSMAVVAGINLMISPVVNISFSKLKATSKDGHSKAFDEAANGYGRGEGGGVIILKPLSKAIEDNDNILGVIRGTGINQDGKSNGLTAPNGASQAKLIEKTLATAGLEPNDVDYIEMHGTGTKLGDPIEVNAVIDTYCKNRNRTLNIGSVKSNIGHLEAAAGMAAVIKVLLSLGHETIPGNLHFNNPNPFINWDKAPINVIDKNTNWKKDDHIRRAGINGFGFGGSNAHVIIEEYKAPVMEDVEEQNGIDYVLKLSARSKGALKELVSEYEELIEKSEESLGDIVASTDQGRADLDYRVAVTGKSKEEIIENLNSFLDEDETAGSCSNVYDEKKFGKDRKIVFMFTGQGSQYVNMGKLLYETSKVFKDSMDKCDKLFKPYLLKSIVDLLYGEKADADVLERTVYAQPAIFTIEYALSKYWESCGVVPEVVMGHSIGEYAAAVVAKIMTLEAAVKLVAIRGRLMDSAPGHGSMGTIFATEQQVTQMIEPYKDIVSIAAHNAAETCVISGESEAVEEILKEAEQKGIRISRLKVSHGFHSPLMEPVLDDFKGIADEVTYNPAQVRFVSALYAKEIESEQILDSSYWTKHIRAKVDFYEAVKSIEKADDYIFMEIGSTRVLAAMCKLIFGDSRVIVTSLNRKKEEGNQLAETIANLYVTGVDIEWKSVNMMGNKNWKRCNLPTYPFERVRYWKDLVYDGKQSAQVNSSDSNPLIGEKVESPFMGDGVFFQRRFTSSEPFFMTEHIIFDTPISPAAAHVSMLLSAMKDLNHPKSCTLEEIEFRTPLSAVDDDERKVQVFIQNKGNEKTKFSLVSKDLNNSDDKWTTHCVGNIKADEEYYRADVTIDTKEYEAMEFDEDVEDKVYSLMRSSGFNLGDSFRRIRKTSYHGTEGVCRIEPLKNVPDLDIYELYPGIIDSIFQTGLSVVFDTLIEQYDYKENKQTIIPYYMGKITYNYRKSDNLWCHTVAEVKDDIIYANIEVFNDDGELIMEIKDSMAKITDRDSLLREVKKNHNKLYYHSEWVERKAGSEKKDKTDYQYIVVAEEKDSAQKVADLLSDAIVVSNGNEYEKEAEDSYKINLSKEEDWKQLLAANASGKKVKLVYCSGLEDSCGLEAKADSFDHVQGLFTAVKAAVEMGMDDKMKVKILTRDVQALDNKKAINMTQSMLWGFSKVLSIEYATMYGGIIDIDEESMSGDASLLVEEMKGGCVEEVCIKNGNKRYVSKLMKHTEYMKNKKEQLKPITVSENGTYLITGGTGTLGLVYANCLIEKGAKKLVLMSRRAPKDNVVEQMNQWKEMGVESMVLNADVTSFDSLKEGIESLPEQFRDIRGVVHAAGTLRDSMIKEMTWEDFETVLMPKVKGTLNVYRVLDKAELDFFIMLSSITSVVGNMGQSNYAAANYYMNSFAQQMQQSGQAGFTFCWGPWSSGGMATENDAIAKNIANMGMQAFSIELGSQIIQEFIEQPYTNLMVADINWEKLNDNFSGAGKKEFLQKLTLEFVKEEGQEQIDTSFLDKLTNLPKDKRKDLLIETMQKTCGKVMGFSKEQLLDVNASFNEQGADSLMIFSMRTSINKMLHTDINVSTFFNYPTITKLANYLLDEVLFADEAVEEETNESVEDLLAELSDLTD